MQVTFFDQIAQVATVSQWVRGLGHLSALEGSSFKGASEFRLRPGRRTSVAPQTKSEIQDGNVPMAWGPFSGASQQKLMLTRIDPLDVLSDGGQVAAFNMWNSLWDCLDLDSRTCRSFDNLLEALQFVSRQEHQVEYAIVEEERQKYVVYRGSEHEVMPGLMGSLTGGCYLHTHRSGRALPSIPDLIGFFRAHRFNPHFFSLIYSKPPSGHELALVKPISSSRAMIWHWQDLPDSRQRHLKASQFEVKLEELMPTFPILQVAQHSPVGGALRCYRLDPWFEGINEQTFWNFVLGLAD